MCDFIVLSLKSNRAYMNFFFFFFDKHVKICITIFNFFTEEKQVAEELQSTKQQPSVKHDYNTQSQEQDRKAEGLHKTTKSVPHALRKTVLRRQFEHHESRAGSYWPPQPRLQIPTTEVRRWASSTDIP